MRGDDLALATLAESVADGSQVDWQAAEVESPRVRRLARHLRLVDSIATLHRTTPIEETAPVPPPETQAPRGKRWGRLVLLEQIGSGTSCDVFRAWDAELHRDVALKLLHDDSGAASKSTPGALQSQAVDDGGLQARVLHEARRMARLSHEHVVRVYGAEQHDGRVGLWMELVRGTSLEDLVQQRGALGPSEAALIGLDLCAALAAVHGAGLLHRDVKAQNVMREDGGRIVLMDFGTGEELAGTNRLVGTPLYLAPEIFQGERASVQTDIYALGVLLYYLVTGKFPVTASTMQELARAHKQRDRRALRDLRPDAPQSFVAVVERALDSDPARRYRSVGELESALRDSFVPQRVRIDERRPDPVAALEPARQARWRPSTAVVIAAAVALLLIAIAFIVWTRNNASADGRPPRLAVLPFHADVSTAGAPYLADQLIDDLIGTLGRIKAIQVPSLATVLPFKGSTAPPSQIGRSLQADHLLLSTLEVSPGAGGQPERVRVRSRLLMAGSGTEIWSREFEGSLGEVKALYGQMARAIATAMGVSLTPAEEASLGKPRTTLPAANDAYYLGLHLLSQSSTDATGAVAAFRRAIELDPEHAGAHAGLARGLMGLGFIGSATHAAARATAASEVRRALELDPDSSEAYAVEADLRFFYDWDWNGAEQSYRHAIELNPSFARAQSQYARFLAAAGRSTEAILRARQGVEIEPTSASAVSTRALIEYYGRDYPTALASADHAIRLEPDSGSHHLVRARILAATGDDQGAILAMERAIDLGGKGTPTSWRAHLLRLRAQAGDRVTVRADLAALIDRVNAERQNLHPTHIAYVYEALGDRGAAIELLERAATNRDPDVLWLKVDPRVDGLRTDPRFMQVIETLNIPR